MVLIVYKILVVASIAASFMFLARMLADKQPTDIVGLMFINIAQVGLIELGLRLFKAGGASTKDLLFYVHLAFAIGYAAFLVLAIVKFSPKWLYAMTVSYSTMSALGAYMLMTRF